MIGARTVVTRDVPPYAIVAGAPAWVVGYRFEEPIREALLRIRWWDWPEGKVRAHVDQLASPAVEEFVARHDPASRQRAFCPACEATG